MKKAREYRAMAKDTLGHNIFGTKFMYALLALLVYSLIVGLISATGIGAIAMLFLSGPFAVGIISVFLRIVRKEDEKAEISHLFDGFKDKFSQSFVTYLLKEVFIFLWSLLFIIPGIIKSFSYSAAMYLVREKNLEGNAAITESRRLMKGKKWKLFCLNLSFIGWYIVGLLCFGVGLLWVDAYRQTAQTHFFEDVLKDAEVIEVKAAE